MAALREALLSVMNASSGQDNTSYQSERVENNRTIGEVISEKINANADYKDYKQSEHKPENKHVEYKKHNPSHSISNETLSDRIDKIENKERARHSAETSRDAQIDQRGQNEQGGQNKYESHHNNTAHNQNKNHTATHSGSNYSESGSTSLKPSAEPTRELPKLTVSEEELKKLFEME